MLASWKESYDKPRVHLKKQGHYFANKGPYSQSYSFSSSHVWMWELDYKESWVLKNWYFWIVVLERTRESHSLDCKEIKPVNPKEINPEYSLERLMLKLKFQYFGTWYKELTQWKRRWCWERLKPGEGDDRGWDCWMASPTQRTCWWWTGRPGMLQLMASQRVGHDWVTELNWTEWWCWIRLSRVTWTARRSNQSILRKSTLNIIWKDWRWSWSSILWQPDEKNWLIRKTSDTGKDWRQEEKGTAEDEMVGWHHRLNGLEFGQALGEPTVLQSTRSQRVGHDWATEQQKLSRSFKLAKNLKK